MSGSPMKAKERDVFLAAQSINASASVVFPDLAEPHIGMMPVPIESVDGSFRRAIVLGAGRQVLLPFIRWFPHGICERKIEKWNHTSI